MKNEKVLRNMVTYKKNVCEDAKYLLKQACKLEERMPHIIKNQLYISTCASEIWRTCNGELVCTVLTCVFIEMVILKYM